MLAALIASVAGAAYSLKLNPELAFFARGADLKEEWIEVIESEYANKVIVFGGSSCTSTVIAKRMRDLFEIPAVNLGLGAGMGARMLTGYALSHANPGDIVIAAIEPDLLIGSLETPSLGVQFAVMRGRAGWIDGIEGIGGRAATLGELRELKPGGYHFFTMLGKLAMGREFYRYSQSEFHADGWQEIPMQLSVAPTEQRELTLSIDAIELLSAVADHATEVGYTILYTIPWSYFDEASAEKAIESNQEFLQEVSEIMPVLDDGVSGVWTHGEDFADTGFHLIKAAAEVRTDKLATALLAWMQMNEFEKFSKRSE